MSFTVGQVTLLNRNAEAAVVKRLFDVTFGGITFRLVEDVIPRVIGGVTWQPGLGWITGGAVERSGSFVASPVEYRVGPFRASMTDDAQASWEALVLAALQDEAAWRDAAINQRLQLYDGEAPEGPAISLHQGFIADVKPFESVAEQYMTIRAESIFSRRNFTPLGQYTDRSRKAAYPGDRGAEFVPSLTRKVITGWAQG